MPKYANEKVSIVSSWVLVSSIALSSLTRLASWFFFRILSVVKKQLYRPSLKQVPLFSSSNRQKNSLCLTNSMIWPVAKYIFSFTCHLNSNPPACFVDFGMVSKYWSSGSDNHSGLDGVCQCTHARCTTDRLHLQKWPGTEIFCWKFWIRSI